MGDSALTDENGIFPKGDKASATMLASVPLLSSDDELRNGPTLSAPPPHEGKENGGGGMCILDTMKPKIHMMKQQQQQHRKMNINSNNNNNGYNNAVNGTLPQLANGGIRYRMHSRSQSPSLFGSSKKRCGPKLDTKERLFGQAMPETPKKKLNDTFRSSIFSDTAPSSPVKTPKKCVPVLERNPITGEVKMPKKITM
ncbi:hypothetical protein niasHS_015669 [Heterodera schachtii]|uniref:Uncharacterized protein n=1 Tax=Heterodera schachtii TaxID=97005 RepID=A0ABD2HNT7_HETSC